MAKAKTAKLASVNFAQLVASMEAEINAIQDRLDAAFEKYSAAHQVDEARINDLEDAIRVLKNLVK
mgnify:CR=1 FL=1